MRRSAFVCFLVTCLLAGTCTLRHLERNLDPESREFYSKVRFIITRQERKIFLNLPPEERPGFIQEFWDKRDPDPETEVNEFREEYFQRIEEADRLFKEGTTPGWTQDRGRVYITLGPPDHRQQYPRGITFYGKPTEIWYYGFFTMTFVDDNWTGNYRLDPYGAHHIAEINQAQSNSAPRVQPETLVFDLDLRVRKPEAGGVVFRFEIPYRNVWFVEDGDSLKTEIAVSLQVLDAQEQEIWSFAKEYPVSLAAERFDELIGKKHVIEVPADLGPGKYILIAEIENKTDNKRVRKTARFDL